ncbi:MAG: RluA family pseudouridine synthase [Verrucomicrobiota bacterium]|nr:RluA family pseudouridine synthase [Verrucomicrobiota bacterium]
MRFTYSWLMPKPDFIVLPGGEPIPILYEDRSVLALDKPRGWMLVPHSWQKTSRNLQAAITSSIAARDFWARSRGLKFLRHVHRLDADTSGVLLFGKSPGAVKTFSDLFESRKMKKTYLAIVAGKPGQGEWTCRLKLAPDPRRIGKMKVDERHGKPAETRFRILEARGGFSLVEAEPITGRTHQIRVHLAESGLSIVGDQLYEKPFTPSLSPRGGERVTECRERDFTLGLRAVRLAYVDPFNKRCVDIHAATDEFLERFGFAPRS